MAKKLKQNEIRDSVKKLKGKFEGQSEKSDTFDRESFLKEYRPVGKKGIK